MADTNQGGFIVTDTVTIADSASLSGSKDLGNRTLVGVITPAGWTTAAITFQASTDGTNFFDLYNTSGEYASGSLAASQFLAVDPTFFLGIKALKVRSGTGGSPVTQSGGDIVTLVYRQVQM